MRTHFFYSFFLFFMMLATIGTAQEKTVYTIGDSTMADKQDPDNNPEHGWGQLLPELMTNEIRIENHAVNGRSSRSFIDEGKWQVVLDKLKAGDYVLIQFGHNDQKIKDASRYTNPFTQYRYNLERFVTESRAKGATPILLTSIVRRRFNESGTLEDTHGAYPLVVRMVADAMEAPFVDLQYLTERLEIAYGAEKSKELHLHFEPNEIDYFIKGKHDDTHLSRKGAKLVASLALQDIAKLDLGLNRYILPSVMQHKILNN